MIDLTQYGFTRTRESERSDEYTGHDLIITVYHYPYVAVDGNEAMRNSFVVSSKTSTSRAFDISELEKWLADKKIVKSLA